MEIPFNQWRAAIRHFLAAAFVALMSSGCATTSEMRAPNPNDSKTAATVSSLEHAFEHAHYGKDRHRLESLIGDDFEGHFPGGYTLDKKQAIDQLMSPEVAGSKSSHIGLQVRALVSHAMEPPNAPRQSLGALGIGRIGCAFDGSNRVACNRRIQLHGAVHRRETPHGAPTAFAAINRP